MDNDLTIRFTTGIAWGFMLSSSIPNPSSIGIWRGSPAISPHMKVLIPLSTATSETCLIIRIIAGYLEPSGRPDYYFYTWRRGDTFVKVAQRLYGDGNHRELLRRHNEGRLDVPVGDQIFVPVFDDGSSPDPLAGGGRLHTVKEGDSLWTIAGEVYGSGARWQRIFDANRDQLQNANQLKSGMVLRIP